MSGGEEGPSSRRRRGGRRGGGEVQEEEEEEEEEVDDETEDEEDEEGEEQEEVQYRGVRRYAAGDNYRTTYVCCVTNRESPHNNRQIWLGRFYEARAAAMAYDVFCVFDHRPGEVNFPDLLPLYARAVPRRAAAAANGGGLLRPISAADLHTVKHVALGLARAFWPHAPAALHSRRNRRSPAPSPAFYADIEDRARLAALVFLASSSAPPVDPLPPQPPPLPPPLPPVPFSSFLIRSPHLPLDPPPSFDHRGPSSSSPSPSNSLRQHFAASHVSAASAAASTVAHSFDPSLMPFPLAAVAPPSAPSYAARGMVSEPALSPPRGRFQYSQSQRNNRVGTSGLVDASLSSPSQGRQRSVAPADSSAPRQYHMQPHVNFLASHHQPSDDRQHGNALSRLLASLAHPDPSHYRHTSTSPSVNQSFSDLLPSLDRRPAAAMMPYEATHSSHVESVIDINSGRPWSQARMETRSYDRISVERLMATSHGGHARDGSRGASSSSSGRGQYDDSDDYRRRRIPRELPLFGKSDRPLSEEKQQQQQQRQEWIVTPPRVVVPSHLELTLATQDYHSDPAPYIVRAPFNVNVVAVAAAATQVGAEPQQQQGHMEERRLQLGGAQMRNNNNNANAELDRIANLTWSPSNRSSRSN